MRGLKRFTRSVVPGVLAACVMSLGAPCAAQEVPTHPPSPMAVVRVFAPSAWLVVNTPVRKEIALKIYGFYIGDSDTPVAQFDVPIRTTKFLTITPSYMYYSVPASGLNELPPQPGGFADSYNEHQFRIDGTVAFAVRKLEISGRNMYVRRFRPAPADDINRYRGRIADCVSPRRSRPHLEAVRLIRNVLRRRTVAGTESESGPVSRCHSTSACPSSRPTCGKPAKGVETFTTCCSG